jgi:DNA-binding transcriptional ArsR family regulator
VNCHYAALSPYGQTTLSGSLTAWLRELLADHDSDEHNRELLEVRDYVSDDDRAVDTAIFEAATAFTDARRLQVLRHLETCGQADGASLETELHMSADAVSRHTAKLRRRGYIGAHRRPDRTLVYALSPEPKTAIHGRLFELIRKAWQQA